MKSISGKHLCEIVERKGWVLQRVTGSDRIYVSSNYINSLHRDRELQGEL